MHSESIEDHRDFEKLLKERIGECESEMEKEGVDRVWGFEKKHC